MITETIVLLTAFFVACWFLSAVFACMAYSSWELRHSKYGASLKLTALTIVPLAVLFFALPFIALAQELGFL